MSSRYYLDAAFLTADGNLVLPDATRTISNFDDIPWGLVGDLVALPDRSDLVATLKANGTYDLFDPRHIFSTSSFGLGIADPRTFAAITAATGQPIGQDVFITADPDAAASADAAGWQVVEVGDRSHDMRLLSERRDDVSKRYGLRGRIVTMDRHLGVIEDGVILIVDGQIEGLYDDPETVEAGLIILDTEATIYPGLIDLHNHLAYNVLPLWVVPRKYDNRSQWARHAEYKSNVSQPINHALACYTPTAEAIARYVECRAIMGGTTTAQGLRTQRKGVQRMMKGAMRNIEETDDPHLPEARSRVPDLYPTTDRVASFRRALDTLSRTGGRYFYHLSEGVDSRSRRHFGNLVDHDLLTPALVGIHSLGLDPDDYSTFADAGGSMVWSPFSNLLLYGETVSLTEVKKSDLPVALGCDWSPTGSKNLLLELKVASYVNAEQGGVFSDKELVEMVTSGAAALLGWAGRVGTIHPGAKADLLVVDGTDRDPFSQLIESRERDVGLVCIEGVPRYGRRDWVQVFGMADDSELESILVEGQEKVFALADEASPIDGLRLSEAIERLDTAMADLTSHIEEQNRRGTRLNAIEPDAPEAFKLDLDNEFHLFDDELTDHETEAELLAPPPMAHSVELEAVYVDPDETNYWQRIASQPNLSNGLKQALRRAYESGSV